MEKQRQTATKPAWGVVACIGAMVAVTMADSIAMAGLGAALFALGARLGGYMEPLGGNARPTAARHETTQTEERRVA